MKGPSILYFAQAPHYDGYCDQSGSRSGRFSPGGRVRLASLIVSENTDLLSQGDKFCVENVSPVYLHHSCSE